MRSSTAGLRRGVPTVAALLLGVVATAGCGSDDGGSGGSGAAAGDEAGDYGYDLSDPGDDLLGGARQGVVPDGTETTLSWRVPDGWDAATGQRYTFADDAGEYSIIYGWNADGTPQEQAEAVAGREPDAVFEAETSRTTEVDVAGQETWATTATAPDGASIRAFYLDGEDEGGSYQVILFADVPADDVAEELLDAFHQSVASVDLEPFDPGSLGERR